jgi:hypothetical protein
VNVRHICRDRAHRRSTCAPPAIGQQPLGMPRPLGAVEMDRGRWSSHNQESHSRSRNRTRSRGSTPPQPTDVLRPSVNPVAECRPRKYRLYPSRIQMNALVPPSNAESAGDGGCLPCCRRFTLTLVTGPAARTWPLDQCRTNCRSCSAHSPSADPGSGLAWWHETLASRPGGTLRWGGCRCPHPDRTPHGLKRYPCCSSHWTSFRTMVRRSSRPNPPIRAR